MDEFTIKDVEYKEECWCEHCGDLEPFTATYGDGCDYCVDCGRMGDLVIDDADYEKIITKELEHKLVYFEERVASIKIAIATRMGV